MRGGLVHFANPALAPADVHPALRVVSIDLETDPSAGEIWSIALLGDGIDEVHLAGRGDGSRRDRARRRARAARGGRAADPRGRPRRDHGLERRRLRSARLVEPQRGAARAARAGPRRGRDAVPGGVRVHARGARGRAGARGARRPRARARCAAPRRLSARRGRAGAARPRQADRGGRGSGGRDRAHVPRGSRGAGRLQPRGRAPRARHPRARGSALARGGAQPALGHAARPRRREHRLVRSALPAGAAQARLRGAERGRGTSSSARAGRRGARLGARDVHGRRAVRLQEPVSELDPHVPARSARARARGRRRTRSRRRAARASRARARSCRA